MSPTHTSICIPVDPTLGHLEQIAKVLWKADPNRDADSYLDTAADIYRSLEQYVSNHCA